MSDIHSNYQALRAVFYDIKKKKINKIYCIGDIIGYGPQPNKVINFLKEHNIMCTKGNNDFATFHDDELDTINDDAKESILITRKLLTKDAKKFLRSLPTHLEEDTILLVHGMPPDDIMTYISDISHHEIKEALKNMKQQFCFVGHTHELKLYSLEESKLIVKDLHRGTTMLPKTRKHIINIGSVGQPRDDNHDAKYVIFDTKTNTLEVRYVPYNIDRTAELIEEKGLPEDNAERLY